MLDGTGELDTLMGDKHYYGSIYQRGVYFKFYATAFTTYSIQVGCREADCASNPIFHLYFQNQHGAMIEETVAKSLSYRPKQSGTMFVLVSTTQIQDFGSYTLSVEEIPTDTSRLDGHDRAHPVTLPTDGTVHSFELDPGAEFWTRIQVDSGMTYKIQKSCNTTQCLMYSNLNAYRARDTSPVISFASLVEYASDFTGTLLVQLKGRTPDQAGPFTLSTQRIEGSNRDHSIGLVVDGAPISDSLGIGQATWFRFSLDSGRSYQVQVDCPQADSFPCPGPLQLTLFTPQAALPWISVLDPAKFIAPLSGSFVMKITPQVSSHHGKYALRVFTDSSPSEP